jgi:hypothetical protein
MKRPSTIPFCHAWLALLAIGLAASASAQSLRPPQATSSDETPASLTGKERLGRKWTDEQRIDNCNVPIDKRGARPRPDSCARASGS